MVFVRKKESRLVLFEIFGYKLATNKHAKCKKNANNSIKFIHCRIALNILNALSSSDIKIIRPDNVFVQVIKLIQLYKYL